MPLLLPSPTLGFGGSGGEEIGDHVFLGLPQTALDTFSFGYQNSPTSQIVLFQCFRDGETEAKRS